MPSKKHRFHFYADECIPLQSVTYLREKGINIIHVFDRNNIKKSDSFQFRYSKKIKSIFLSLDKDVERFESSSLKNHPGVILIKVTTVTYKNINQVLDKLLKNLSQDNIEESIVKISNDMITKEKNGKVTKKSI